MSDVKYIMAQVFMADIYGTGLICDTIAKEPVSAENQVLGEEWYVPFSDNGTLARYDRVIQPLAPTLDAVRTVRLRNPDTGATVWILGLSSDWVDRVNACCGATPSMPDQTLPAVSIEDAPCGVPVCVPGSTTYQYVDVIPVMVVGDAVVLSGSANGVAFTPVAPATGFASAASALAWAIANWGAYGTWTLSPDGDGLTLTSTTAVRGQVNVVFKGKGGIATHGAITGGTLYTNGVYKGVPLTGGTGSGATADITVAGNAVTVVTMVKPGIGYTVGDVLSANAGNIGGTGSGFSTPVATIQVGA
jgi:hypothetical protein